MSNLFYRNPRLLLLTLALIAVAGFSAVQVLPRAEDPQLMARNAQVLTRLPGASAERVEALVTEKIEDELSEIEEIRQLRSTSRTNISVISIELLEEVTDIEPVWTRVRDVIEDARALLPAGAHDPEFEEFDIRAYTLIAGLVWNSEAPLNPALLGRHAEELADTLRAVPGTDEAELFGAIEEEVLVEVDPARLASLGLTPGEVSNLVSNSDAKVSAGVLRAASSELSIEVDGELDSLARIRQIPLAYGAGGEVVRLGDLARVEKTVRDPAASLALLNGERGVAVGARLRDGQRVDLWAADARAALAQFEAALPRGLALEGIFDQSGYTEERLGDLTGNLLLGAALVMLVVLFTMGWQSALLVGAALPLSMLMVLQGMRLLGIPIHQMSVTGLIIALGLLIDNAIVMVDEVRHRLERGMAPAEAISDAVRTMSVPLVGSTLTTILAFLPIVLMPGGAGEFVGAMGVSVILALASSLFLALTVVPALTGMAARLRLRVPGPRWLESGFSSTRGTALYEAVLSFFFARPVVAALFFAILPLAGFIAARQLGEQFFPPADRDQYQIDVRLPQQSSLAETTRVARAMHRHVSAHPEVEAAHFFVGSSAPKFYYNMLPVEEAPYFAQAMVQLDSAAAARGSILSLQEELDREFPEAQVLVRQLEQGPPFDAPVELYLSGPDLDILRETGEDLRALLAEVPGVIHTRASLSDDRPKLLLEADEVETNRAGLGHTAIAMQLQTALEGAVGGSLLEATEELPVRVRVAGIDRSDPERLASLEVLADGSDRSWTPIEALGELRLIPELASIPRRDGRRTNTVQGFVEAGLLPGGALEVFAALLEGYELPPGVHASFGGEAAERDEAVGNLMASVGILLVLMVATLVLSFQSFRLASIIGSVAVLSVGLSLGALWLSGYPFGFMAIVGTMGLMGVAINDAIVVLAALKSDERAMGGDAEAVRAVVVRSTRHVVSTTLTTIAGFLPLLMAGGDFWPPLAIAIAGGVSGATMLALGFVPAAFLFVRCRCREGVGVAQRRRFEVVLQGS